MTLQVRDLSAGFAGRPVISGIDLDAFAGEIVTILGDSGSGKTTLLRAIAGLHPIESGTVRLGGRDVTHWPTERRRIGLVPQEGALFPQRSVAANIGYGLRRADRADRVGEMLELIGLSDRGQAMPHELSGGERQRVALARALAPAPPVLLLDEPFSSLDTQLRQSLRTETARIIEATSTAAVLVTHDVVEALSMSQQIIILEGGRIIASGTPRELYQRPPSARVAARLGAVELLWAEPCGRRRVTTALGELATTEDVVGPAGCLAAVRPEQLIVTSLEVSGPSSATARIVWIDYRGDSQVLGAQIDDGTILTVRADPHHRWRKGDGVLIGVSGPVHVVAAEGE